jgi:methionyl-tRNA synthetase
MAKFYITTTLPYVNSKPHIGTALEFIRADAIARYKKLVGHDVYFNTGTDEHGIKIQQKATELRIDTQKFVDENAEHFRILKEKLNLSYDTEGIEGRFIRTTDEDHKRAAQEFWKRCSDAGYIYKKNYKGLYCVGCEMFLTEKELVDGYCPNHPNKKPEEIEEENYFFKFSEFAKDLKDYYEKNPDFVIPESRSNEMKARLNSGLEDFSISRLKERLSWGVPVPDDKEQVMYVWFDALINYISTLGWPEDKEGKFKDFWADGETVQICGKDNTQHQALRWQAMLKSVGLPYTNHVLVNGFVTSGGQKMSKSLGNVIDPLEIVERYGTDALRYYVLRELHPYEDSDFTIEKFEEAYNANLANGVGNLTSRILKLAEDHLDECPGLPEKSIPQNFKDAFDKFDYYTASNIAWNKISELDQKIQDTEPFKLIKTDKDAAKEIIKELVIDLYTIGRMLNPLLPETSQKIKEAVKANKKPEKPLFVRI